LHRAGTFDKIVYFNEHNLAHDLIGYILKRRLEALRVRPEIENTNNAEAYGWRYEMDSDRHRNSIPRKQCKFRDVFKHFRAQSLAELGYLDQRFRFLSGPLGH
jgi:hypothetical protein